MLRRSISQKETDFFQFNQGGGTGCVLFPPTLLYPSHASPWLPRPPIAWQEYRRLAFTHVLPRPIHDWLCTKNSRRGQPGGCQQLTDPPIIPPNPPPGSRTPEHPPSLTARQIWPPFRCHPWRPFCALAQPLDALPIARAMTPLANNLSLSPSVPHHHVPQQAARGTNAGAQNTRSQYHAHAGCRCEHNLNQCVPRCSCIAGHTRPPSDLYHCLS